MKFKKDKIQKKDESKENRFRRVASRRVKEILNKLRLLKNCANKSVYSYTDEQARKIINTIDEELKHVKSEFNKKISKREFSL